MNLLSALSVIFDDEGFGVGILPSDLRGRTISFGVDTLGFYLLTGERRKVIKIVKDETFQMYRQAASGYSVFAAPILAVQVIYSNHLHNGAAELWPPEEIFICRRPSPVTEFAVGSAYVLVAPGQGINGAGIALRA